MSSANMSSRMAYISILPIANKCSSKPSTNGVTPKITSTTTARKNIAGAPLYASGLKRTRAIHLGSKLRMSSSNHHEHGYGNQQEQKQERQDEQAIQSFSSNNDNNNKNDNNDNHASLAVTTILIASAAVASFVLFPHIQPAIASTSPSSPSTTILHQSDFLLGFVAQLQKKAIDLLPFEGIEGLYSYILSLGFWGEFVYGFIYFVLELVAIPALPLTLGAGFLFGAVKGTITVSLAANAAAAVSFLISRYLLRDIVSRYAVKNSTFRKIDRAIGTHGFRIVLLLRLSPLLPFSLSNYLYGITSVNFWEYVGGTVLGMLPGTIAYVYGGNAGREISGHSGSPNWFTLALGVLATIGAVTVLGRIATDAMKEDLPDSDNEFEGGGDEFGDGVDEATGLPLSRNFRIRNTGGEHVAAIKGSKSVLKIASDDEGSENDLSP